MKKGAARVNRIFDVLRRDHITDVWDGTGKTGRKSERHKSIRCRSGIALDVLVIVLDVLVVAALVGLTMIVHW